MVHIESDIKRRRYTVHMADLEKTVLYSLSHEVAQHQVITGEALNALHEYIDIVTRFFPARHRTRQFLEELRTWILGHDDALKGEDLSDMVENIKVRFSAFDDLPQNWIGCRGSAAQFGGYPCGLWTLWHTMTVSHAEKSRGHDEDSKEAKLILKAMVGFIDHFFSCRECARHFLQAAEDGKAIDRDVHSLDDSILWLWKTHNKVNIRLSGDITDDSSFPKTKFPDKEHCSGCYSNAAGSDLWSEFRLNKIIVFLKDLYGTSGIIFSKLVITDKEDKDLKHPAANGAHELVTVPAAVVPARDRLVHDKEFVDKDNFRRNSNENQAGWSFFSTADVSICFSVYFVSAVILILVYVKFIAKRKCSWYLSSLCPRSRANSPYTNPLLGKV